MAAIPALFVALCMVAFFDRTGATARSLGLVPVVALTSTVAILPFLVLAAYVLRIATVTKRTLSIGPFIPRETEQVAEVEWDDAESR